MEIRDEFADEEREEARTRRKVVSVLKEFKRMNPWHGKIEERKSKFKWCFEELKKIYELNGWKLEFDVASRFSEWTDSDASNVNFLTKTVTLKGRLSVITFLHEIGHVIGEHEQEQAQDYAKMLFTEVFPEKMEKLKVKEGTGYMLVKKREGE